MAGHAAEAALSPVALALEYLAHPFSKPSLIPPVARPLSPPTLASLIPGFTMPSFKTIGRLSNLVTFATMTVMLIRTYLYVTRRRVGSVGPAPAPILMQFCAVHGVVQFLTFVLTLYLSPLSAAWIPFTLRAALLLAMCYGRQLPLAQILYRRCLAPFYQTHHPQIDAYLATARHKWYDLNETISQVAAVLLKRLSVGGLPALIQFPSVHTHLAATSTASNADSEPRDATDQTESQDREPRLPQQFSVFPSGGPFFAGQAEHRAKAAASVSIDNLHGAIQSATVVSPKPAFEEARAMRMRFRQRAASLKRAAKKALA